MYSCACVHGRTYACMCERVRAHRQVCEHTCAHTLTVPAQHPGASGRQCGLIGVGATESGLGPGERKAAVSADHNRKAKCFLCRIIKSQSHSSCSVALGQASLGRVHPSLRERGSESTLQGHCPPPPRCIKFRSDSSEPIVELDSNWRISRTDALERGALRTLKPGTQAARAW